MGNNHGIAVLFVCMGNICRSPTAHGVFQAMVDEQGLGDQVLVDSAGTHGYHVGGPPDYRSQVVAKARGVDISHLTARQFNSRDFLKFDYLIALDQTNLSDMLSLKPTIAHVQPHLLLSYSQKYKQRDVPDPYFGDYDFDSVFDMICDAAAGLLNHIKRDYSL